MYSGAYWTDQHPVLHAPPALTELPRGVLQPGFGEGGLNTPVCVELYPSGSRAGTLGSLGQKEGSSLEVRRPGSRLVLRKS